MGRRPPAAAQLDRECGVRVRAQMGAALRRMYAEIVSEGAPARFVEVLRDSVLTDLKEIVTKFISRAGHETAKSAREAREVGSQIGAAASDIAGRGANVATDQAKTLATELENIARRSPLGSIAGAVVVGVLIGMLGRRS